LSLCKESIDYFIQKYGVDAFSSLGITGQMHGVLYVNNDGKCISPLITWQDRRAEIFENGINAIQEIYNRTGKYVPAGYGLATHFYNKCHNMVPKDIAKICTIHSFVAMTLTNTKKPVMHVSDCHSFGLYDSETDGWDFSSIALLGISEDILPKIVSNPFIIGNYKGISVCVAIGDNQASFIGSVKSFDSLLINIGTGAQVSVLADNEDKHNIEIRPLSGKYLIAVGCSLAGGLAYETLKNFFRDVYKMANLIPPENIYECMNKTGELNDNAPLFDTRFIGTRKNPEIRGSIENLGIHNFTAANFIYGVLKGIANELYSLYKQLNVDVDKIVGSGNAIRKNPLLRKIIEETFQMQLKIPINDEEAAFGAAIYGIVASKRFPDISSAVKSLVHLEN